MFCQSNGYILNGVKPGIVFTSLINTSSSAVTKKSARTNPDASKILNARFAISLIVVTTVSDTMRAKIIESGVPKENTSRIYNFVDRKEFSPKKKDYWKNIGSPVVFFVSKLSPNKGVEFLIKSASIVRDSMPNVKYFIAGPVSFEHEEENPWMKIVKDLKLENTVFFTGKIDRKDLPAACASSDVFCFPTLKESFGIVIAEAMACGLPIISTDIPVVREICGNSAVLVKEKDTEKIASATVDILKNKSKRGKLSKLSLERSKIFDKKEIMRQYEELYDKM